MSAQGSTRSENPGDWDLQEGWNPERVRHLVNPFQGSAVFM